MHDVMMLGVAIYPKGVLGERRIPGIGVRYLGRREATHGDRPSLAHEGDI